MSSRVTLANVLAQNASEKSGLPVPASPAADSLQAAKKDGFRVGASVLVERLRFASSVFEQYSGKRDLHAVFGWKKFPDFDDWVDHYERGDIAQRIVDIPAEETWFAFPTVEDASGPDGSFARAFKRLTKQLNLPEAFTRLDRAAGLGRYGVAIVGLRDGRQLLQEAGQVRSTDDVMFLATFAEGSASFGDPIEDPRNPRFGKPAVYHVDLTRGSDFEFVPGRDTGSRRTTEGNQPTSGAINTIAADIHHSRVLHLAEGRLESDLFGIPRLKPVFNALYDKQKIIGGAAETFWLNANKGLHANVDPNVVRQIDQDDLDRLSEDMELYRDQLVRVLRTTGVDIQHLGSEVSNPRGPFAVVAAIIAGTTRIPWRMLFPGERGAQTSVHDRIAFREEVILPRQKRVAEPQVVRPFVDLMIRIGAMPKPAGDDYDVIWPDPVSRSRADQLELAEIWSTAVFNLSRTRQFGSPVTEAEERRILGLPSDKPADEAPVESPAPESTDNPTSPDDDNDDNLPTTELPPELEDVAAVSRTRRQELARQAQPVSLRDDDSDEDD